MRFNDPARAPVASVPLRQRPTGSRLGSMHASSTPWTESAAARPPPRAARASTPRTAPMSTGTQPVCVSRSRRHRRRGTDRLNNPPVAMAPASTARWLGPVSECADLTAVSTPDEDGWTMAQLAEWAASCQRAPTAPSGATRPPTCAPGSAPPRAPARHRRAISGQQPAPIRLTALTPVTGQLLDADVEK